MERQYIDSIDIVEGITIDRYTLYIEGNIEGYYIRVGYTSKPRTKDYYYPTLEGLISGTESIIQEYKDKGFSVIEKDCKINPFI